jgi:hypothetical protein
MEMAGKQIAHDLPKIAVPVSAEYLSLSPGE